MAVMNPARPKTTSGTSGFPTATSRQGPNVLRKSRSSTVAPLPPLISRRHSWTSTPELLSKRDLQALDSEDMEISDISSPLGSHGYPQMADSLLSNKRAFSSTRPGATFDMAYFLRHTGPPATPSNAPAREPVKDDAKRADRKKNRGGIFRKRRDSPDLETPTEPEEQRPAIFVPPEGVEQKVTARGNKYLQIVPHPDLAGLGRVYASRPYNGPQIEHAEAVSTEALDTWISSLSLHQDGADLSVKPPNFNSMEAHETTETLPGSRTLSPLSFVSEARSTLPSARDGFGLSIVDGHALEPYCNGSSDPSDALCGNPPSQTESPPRTMHSHSSSVETVDMDIPLLDEPLPEALKPIPARGSTENRRIEKMDEKRTHDRRPNDVLAGHVLRRPVVCDDFSLRQNELSSPEICPAAKMQARRNREAIVRARKIRALQQAKKTMENMMKERDSALVMPPTTEELAEAFDDILRPAILSPPPGYPPRHINRLTKTMVVAEQAPVPRSRPLRKPARLVLRERSLERRTTAERREEQEATSSDSDVDTSPEKQQQKPFAPPQQLPNLPAKSLARNTPASTAFFTPHSHAKHHSTPLLSTSALSPQAVTATAFITGGIRASLCSSSHTSTSREARLEARLEAVERENRLLEAALMAVLKTSGTLNRCPCVLLKERSDTATKNTEHLAALKPAALVPLPASKATTPLPVINAQNTDLARVSEENANAAKRNGVHTASSSASSTHTRRGSWDSNGSGISALEVYLRTKIGT